MVWASHQNQSLETLGTTFSDKTVESAKVKSAISVTESLLNKKLQVRRFKG